MKVTRFGLLILVILMGSTAAFGAPFLVADPYPAKGGPAKFLVTINGKTYTSLPVKNSDGSLYLKYDLGGLPDGTYQVSVKAVDRKGFESAPGVCQLRKVDNKVDLITPPEGQERKGAGVPDRRESSRLSGACAGFLDKTAELRKEFDRKRSDYWGLKGDPKAKPEDVARYQQEVRTLWKRIQEENPENCRWQD